MSLDEVAKECRQAADELANQPGYARNLDALMGEEHAEFAQTSFGVESHSLSGTDSGYSDALRARFEAERRNNRADAIENLEALATLLERLPACDYCGYQMTGYGSYFSRVIFGAVEVLKNNN